VTDIINHHIYILFNYKLHPKNSAS